MDKQYVMRELAAVLLMGSLTFVTGAAHAQPGPVAPFHKVIISPYIQASFVQGNEESVTVNSTIADSGKLHVEVQNGSLRLYLEGAKDFPHDQRAYDDEGRMQNHHLYPDHAVVVTVTYRKLDGISLRGSETYLFGSPLSAKKLDLRVYGESKVIFTEVHISKMHTFIYGESSLEMRSGEVDKQYYTCFGNGIIQSTAITGEAAKVTAFGDAEFNVNVSDRIKVTAIGDARLRYLGNPAIVKGIHIGEIDLRKVD